ncbi:hypothetical protein [Photobacterium lipolyticum]|uniref:Uncharacterized protein n=1 Tax=Photobacterium lipolyticum TaxID=266810 RepID=A0A2T3MQU2_9GAMM|nr:hypothetical protein [Photobacterium lipolyticum]PSV99574.1 hypothetical protein C9I89_21730 [Photobacterium lipolyticum]
MYKEPWISIDEYPDQHAQNLLTELMSEISWQHQLSGKVVKLLAKREDRDDVLVATKSGFAVVHMTWSGKEECQPYPLFKEFDDLESLEAQLIVDSKYF